jgi:hypothetical protein
LKGIDDDDLLGKELHHLVKPGNLVDCSVLKILNNGLVVRFLRFFFGFIFQDHLE